MLRLFIIPNCILKDLLFLLLPVAGAGGCAAWLRGALYVCCRRTAPRRGPPADAPPGQSAAGA
jgi:hypothetical protein